MNVKNQPQNSPNLKIIAFYSNNAPFLHLFLRFYTLTSNCLILLIIWTHTKKKPSTVWFFRIYFEFYCFTSGVKRNRSFRSLWFYMCIILIFRPSLLTWIWAVENLSMLQFYELLWSTFLSLIEYIIAKLRLSCYYKE